MQPFEWRRPQDVTEAVEALRSGADPKLIAGGMTLIPTLKQGLGAPSELIDLARIPGLTGIAFENGELIVRAMTTHAAVASAALTREHIPALADLAAQIGDPCVRRRGTIGGSVANADPAADYPAGVIGLDAIVETSERRIPADDFFVGLFETALKPDEIVTAVRFKKPDRAHYVKFRHPASGYAVVGLMVARFGDKTRVAITGAGPYAFRYRAMEQALDSEFSPQATQTVSIDPNKLMGDMHCSARYRAHVIGVLAKRAVAAIA